MTYRKTEKIILKTPTTQTEKILNSLYLSQSLSTERKCYKSIYSALCAPPWFNSPPSLPPPEVICTFGKILQSTKLWQNQKGSWRPPFPIPSFGRWGNQDLAVGLKIPVVVLSPFRVIIFSLLSSQSSMWNGVRHGYISPTGLWVAHLPF